MHAAVVAATDAEITAAAAYFSGLRMTRRFDVVEARRVPRTHVAGWMYVPRGSVARGRRPESAGGRPESGMISLSYRSQPVAATHPGESVGQDT
jgi:hypothetical protein